MSILLRADDLDLAGKDFHIQLLSLGAERFAISVCGQTSLKGSHSNTARSSRLDGGLGGLGALHESGNQGEDSRFADLFGDT